MVEQTAKEQARWYHLSSLWGSIVVRPKVLVSAAVGVAVLVLLPASFSPAAREAMAWCIGGLTYLALALRIMKTCDSAKIKQRAALQDDSAMVILILILLAVGASMAAIAGLLSEAKTASESSKILYVAMAAATIFISWSVMQVVFALHYAHEHYAPENLTDDKAGGLEFPKDDKPDYWDFLYFATSIGAASQTSDVSIASKGLRHLVTLHAIVAFFFNTMVLALAINTAASMI